MRPGLFIVCLFLFACGNEAPVPLVATDVVIKNPLPGQSMSAGYLSLSNNTGSAITISRVVSNEFESVEIHESLLEDGVAKMRTVTELVIAAHSNVLLASGGKHLMLMRPVAPLKTVSLRFYDDDTLLLSVTAAVTRGNN